MCGENNLFVYFGHFGVITRGCVGLISFFMLKLWCKMADTIQSGFIFHFSLGVQQLILYKVVLFFMVKSWCQMGDTI